MGDDDDELVWLVEATDPADGGSFEVTLGTTPPSFREVVALPADAIAQMSGDILAGVIITLTGPGVTGASMAFEPDLVSQDTYLDAANDRVPRETIEAGVALLCPSQPP